MSSFESTSINLVIDSDLVQWLGLDSACLISLLTAIQQMRAQSVQSLLDEGHEELAGQIGEYFSITYDRIERVAGLSLYKTRKVCKRLAEVITVETIRDGMSYFNKYTINGDLLDVLKTIGFANNLSYEETVQLDASQRAEMFIRARLTRTESFDPRTEIFKHGTEIFEYGTEIFKYGDNDTNDPECLITPEKSVGAAQKTGENAVAAQKSRYIDHNKDQEDQEREDKREYIENDIETDQKDQKERTNAEFEQPRQTAPVEQQDLLLVPRAACSVCGKPAVEQESCVYHLILARYGELFPRKSQHQLSNRRLQVAAERRWKDRDFRAHWDDGLKRASLSRFIQDSSWFSLRWYLANEDNWAKCYEGNYDNPKGARTQLQENDAVAVEGFKKLLPPDDYMGRF